MVPSLPVMRIVMHRCVKKHHLCLSDFSLEESGVAPLASFLTEAGKHPSRTDSEMKLHGQRQQSHPASPTLPPSGPFRERMNKCVSLHYGILGALCYSSLASMNVPDIKAGALMPDYHTGTGAAAPAEPSLLPTVIEAPDMRPPDQSKSKRH